MMFFSTFIYIFNYKLFVLSYIFMITIKMSISSNCNLYFGKPWFNCNTFPVNFLLEGEGDATFPSLDCFWSKERNWLTEKTNT